MPQCEVCLAPLSDNHITFSDRCYDCLTMGFLSSYLDDEILCVKCNKNKSHKENMVQTKKGLACRQCYPETWNSGNDVQSNRYQEIKSKIRYGVEFETARCPNYRLINVKPFGCHYDCSIEGMEFVSPILRGDQGLNLIRKFCKTAKKNRFRINQDCGLHLHIDMSNMTHKKCKSIVLAYLLTEKMWFELVKRSRRHNHFCENIRAYAQPEPINEIVGFFMDGEFDRQCWINWEAYYDHGSLEVRLHHATLDSSEVINWIKFNLWFVDFFKNKSFKTIKKILENKSTKEQLLNVCKYTCKSSKVGSFYKRKLGIGSRVKV